MDGDTDVRDECDVTVVIPARDAARTLGVQLEALARQRTSRSVEVVVADNGSGDGTRDVVRAHADRLPGLRLVDASARTGANAARNVGTRAARGRYVLMCDADDEVSDGWVEAMARGLDVAAGVGGRLERARLNPDFVARWGVPDDWGVKRQHGFLPRPVGASAGFRRSVWEELGGFDERYVRGGTETEFFWRLQLVGHTLLDVPGGVVHYRLRSSFRAMVRQSYVWGRQTPMIYRDFRDSGMPGGVVPGLKRWLWVLRLCVDAVGRRERRRLVDAVLLACEQAGRVVGSMRYRVLFL